MTLIFTMPSVLFGGTMTILIVAYAWWKAPKLRDFDFKALKDS